MWQYTLVSWCWILQSVIAWSSIDWIQHSKMKCNTYPNKQREKYEVVEKPAHYSMHQLTSMHCHFAGDCSWSSSSSSLWWWQSSWSSSSSSWCLWASFILFTLLTLLVLSTLSVILFGESSDTLTASSKWTAHGCCSKLLQIVACEFKTSFLQYVESVGFIAFAPFDCRYQKVHGQVPNFAWWIPHLFQSS